MRSRIPRVNALLQRELNSILLREFPSPEGLIITITRIETTPNLQEARIFIGVHPDEKTKEGLRFLEKNVYHIQQRLNERLRMRPVPKIVWREETATQEHVEEILDQIKEEE